MTETVQVHLTPLQAKAMQELELAQLMAMEILAHAVWTASSLEVPSLIVRSYRGEAHRRMEVILNQVELVMTQCEGRA